MEQHERFFDEGLKHILENPPPIPPNEEVLQGMYERLEAESGGSFWPFFTWPNTLWLALFALPFLVGMGFLYHQITQANQHIYDLELQLTNASTTTTFSDTSVRQHTIYQYDTIVEVVHIRRKLVQWAPQTYAFGRNPFQGMGPSIGTNSSILPQASRPGQWALGHSNRSTYYSPLAQIGPGKFPAYPIQGAQGNTSNESSSLNSTPPISPTLSSLFFPAPGFPLYTQGKKPSEDVMEEQNESEHQKRFRARHLLYPFRPNGYQIGGYAPLAYMIGAENIGFGAGLSGAIKYGERLKLRAGGEYLYSKNEEKDEDRLAQIPPGTPERPEDVLKEAYITLNYLELPIGFEYTILPKTKFTPYLGASWVMRKPLSRNIEYEYVGNLEEYKTSSKLPSEGFSFNTMRVSAGTQIPLKSGWNINSAFYYTFDVKKDPSSFIDLNRLSLQLGIQYGFK